MIDLEEMVRMFAAAGCVVRIQRDIEAAYKDVRDSDGRNYIVATEYRPAFDIMVDQDQAQSLADQINSLISVEVFRATGVGK